MKETLCGKDVGSKPWWMSADQFDPCHCKLPKNHADICRCEHMLSEMVDDEQATR